MIELSVMDHGVGFTNALRALLDQFEAAQHVEVRLRVLSWSEGWPELVKVALYSDGPHISEVGSTWINEFVSMNALRPFIGTEIVRLGGAAQFLSSAWQTGMAGGHAQRGIMSWAIPWLADTRLIYYRRDRLERAGVDPATAFQSPPAMLNTLAALQAAGEPMPIVLPTRRVRNTLHNLACWLWGAGGDFVTPDLKRTAFALPQAKAGIYSYFELGRYLSPEARNLDEDQSEAVFAQGRAAVTLSGTWLRMMSDWNAPAVSVNVAQALPPGVLFIGGSHLVVWKHTRQVDPALALVRYLIGADAQAAIARQSGQLPTRLDVFALDAFSHDPFYQMVGQSLQTGRTFPSFALWGLVENKLTDAAADIWADILAAPATDIHAIVDRRLDEVADRLNSTLAYY